MTVNELENVVSVHINGPSVHTLNRKSPSFQDSSILYCDTQDDNELHLYVLKDFIVNPSAWLVNVFGKDFKPVYGDDFADAEVNIARINEGLIWIEVKEK